MPYSQNWMVVNHSWSWIFHNSFYFISHILPVTVYATFRAGWLVISKGTFFKFKEGILSKGFTIMTGNGIWSMVRSAVKSYHCPYSRLFIGYFFSCLYFIFLPFYYLTLHLLVSLWLAASKSFLFYLAAESHSDNRSITTINQISFSISISYRYTFSTRF